MTKPLLFCFEPIADSNAGILILGSMPGQESLDVLQSCTRAGSLDSHIDAGSITVNDFRSFFRTHANIQAVFFNGAMAESAYRRYVLPAVGCLPVSYMRLPSTSPAHASLSYEQKLHAWRVALNAVSQNKPD
jgi:TDG/mug DNA glycosylase family protein